MGRALSHLTTCARASRLSVVTVLRLLRISKRTMAFRAGDAVLALWGRVPKYYPGVVAKGAKQGYLRINWADSETFDDVVASSVKAPRPARGARRGASVAPASRARASTRQTRKRALPSQSAASTVANKSSKKAKTKSAKTKPARGAAKEVLPAAGAKVKVFLEQRGIWCEGEVGRTKGSGRRLMHYVHMLGCSPNDSTHGFYSFRSIKWELLSGSASSATPQTVKLATKTVAAVASAPPPMSDGSAVAPVATASKASSSSARSAATSGGSTALSRAFNAAMGRLYRRADLHQVLRDWDALLGARGAGTEGVAMHSRGSSLSSRSRSSASGGVARSLLAVPSRDVEAASAALQRVRGLAAH